MELELFRESSLEWKGGIQGRFLSWTEVWSQLHGARGHHQHQLGLQEWQRVQSCRINTLLFIVLFFHSWNIRKVVAWLTSREGCMDQDGCRGLQPGMQRSEWHT